MSHFASGFIYYPRKRTFVSFHAFHIKVAFNRNAIHNT